MWAKIRRHRSWAICASVGMLLTAVILPSHPALAGPTGDKPTTSPPTSRNPPAPPSFRQGVLIPPPAPPLLTVLQVPAQSGCTQELPSTTTKDSSGATFYTWIYPNGDSMQQVVPPPTFDTATASTTELSTYMYPNSLVTAVAGTNPRLTPSAARAVLNAPMTRHIGWNYCPAEPKANGYNGQTCGVGCQTSDWAGPTAPPAPPNGNGISYATSQADFNQPYYNSCPTTATGLNWAGLGGINGAAFLQDGTLQVHSNANGGLPYDFIQVWAVNAQNYTYAPEGPAAVVGDDIEGYVIWNYHGGSTGVAEFAVYDLTNNSSWGMDYTLPRAQYGPGVAGNGATIEAISENSPSYPDNLPPSYGYVQFNYLTGEQYITGNYYTFSSMPFMVWANQFNTTNAASQNGYGFQTEWIHC